MLLLSPLSSSSRDSRQYSAVILLTYFTAALNFLLFIVNPSSILIWLTMLLNRFQINWVDVFHQDIWYGARSLWKWFVRVCSQLILLPHRIDYVQLYTLFHQCAFLLLSSWWYTSYINYCKSKNPFNTNRFLDQTTSIVKYTILVKQDKYYHFEQKTIDAGSSRWSVRWGSR